MGRGPGRGSNITTEQVVAYLRRAGHADVENVRLVQLGGDTKSGLKSFGYGRPLLISFDAAGKSERLVLRTMSPDPFSHDQRADRVYQMMLSYDSFRTNPRHIQPRDVGAFADDGQMISAHPGEFFLVTDYVDGTLYADDLARLAGRDAVGQTDVQRVIALGNYLAQLHARKSSEAHYHRHVRDTVGTGEGIFGQSDGYPREDPVATPERLQAIERQAVRWRWKMRDCAHRACVSHGDFHPFNILFREGDDFSVLDCSRGGMGEAADDVTCLTINYLFFSLHDHGAFDGALRQLWDLFWDTYLAASGDREVLEWVALYFTWRCLVLVSPVWYPGLDATLRQRMLRFVERLLDDHPFDPMRVDELL